MKDKHCWLVTLSVSCFKDDEKFELRSNSILRTSEYKVTYNDMAEFHAYAAKDVMVQMSIENNNISNVIIENVSYIGLMNCEEVFGKENFH